MLECFGDGPTIRKDTAEALEDHLTLFVENLLLDSFEKAVQNGENTFKLKYLLEVVKPNDRLFQRVPYLIVNWKETQKLKRSIKEK